MACLRAQGGDAGLDLLEDEGLFVESFNGRMRDEFLNETLFRNLAHAAI